MYLIGTVPSCQVKFLITDKRILRFASKEQQDSRKKSVLLDCDLCELRVAPPHYLCTLHLYFDTAVPGPESALSERASEQ